MEALPAEAFLEVGSRPRGRRRFGPVALPRKRFREVGSRPRGREKSQLPRKRFEKSVRWTREGSVLSEALPRKHFGKSRVGREVSVLSGALPKRFEKPVAAHVELPRKRF